MRAWDLLEAWQRPRFAFLSLGGVYQIVVLAISGVGYAAGHVNPYTVLTSIACTLIVVGLDWASCDGWKS